MNRNNILVNSALMLSRLSIWSDAQMNTPCSPSMLSNVSGCMSFATGRNGTSPTSDCCKALKSLTGTGMDCLCMIVTANVPINLPINRTLAISLPRVCGMPRVPLQCKASAAPLPAPGPMSLDPTPSPTDSQTPQEPDSVRPRTPSATSLNPTDKDPESDKEGEPPSAPPNNSSASFSTNYPKLSFIRFAFVFEIYQILLT